ncbi:Acetyltransferase (GNAT) family protein [Pseudobythopirellula maris]|uniref:Acetyltransferase (GNAT) family protein n=2 Tax=Pseudobythopirellula maris TaxID=2527991 RepID=A0A5C5ZG90_9BACT|nr:Acetyltransferase (GNAT) family protein [Pseudobythopirellula maris]
MTERQALAAGRLLAKVWPKPEKGPRERAAQVLQRGRDYEGPDERGPRSLIIYEGDRLDGERVTAHALVFPRLVRFTGVGEQEVLGLSLVAADPDCRGQGLGAAVVRAAFDLVDEGFCRFAYFQTSNEVLPFYQRMGAVRAENRVFNSLSDIDPTADPFWDEARVRYPKGDAWPTGEIDLLGPGY